MNIAHENQLQILIILRNILCTHATTNIVAVISQYEI